MFIYLIKGILWVQSKNSLKYAHKKKEYETEIKSEYWEVKTKIKNK